MPPRARDSGTVLYATPKVQVPAWIALAIPLLFALGALLLGISTYARMPEAQTIAIFAAIVVMLVAFGLVAYRLQYVGYVLTTEGITIINAWRTHHIPWAEVKAIAQNPETFGRDGRATIVSTHDGRMLTARATATRYRMFRGESGDQPVGGFATVTERPLTETRQAFERYQRGELG